MRPFYEKLPQIYEATEVNIDPDLKLRDSQRDLDESATTGGQLPTRKNDQWIGREIHNQSWLTGDTPFILASKYCFLETVSLFWINKREKKEGMYVVEHGKEGLFVLLIVVFKLFPLRVGV